MKQISEYIKWFCYITISIFLVFGLIVTSNGVTEIYVTHIWKIFFSGLLTTIVTIVCVFRESKTTRGTIIKHLIHYILLCVIMVVCGYWFDWLSLNSSGILMMALAVAAVYGLSFFLYCMVDLKQANDINQRLKEKYQNEE